MTELNRAGQNNSLGDLNISQGNYRDQSDYVSDAIRQLGGKADIEPGANTDLTDPLNAPYVLYVNPTRVVTTLSLAITPPLELPLPLWSSSSVGSSCSV